MRLVFTPCFLVIFLPVSAQTFSGVTNLTCERRNIDRYRRTVAVRIQVSADPKGCRVAEGWAVAYRQFLLGYTRDEVEAGSAGRISWFGAFVMPWD